MLVQSLKETLKKKDYRKYELFVWNIPQCNIFKKKPVLHGNKGLKISDTYNFYPFREKS